MERCGHWRGPHFFLLSREPPSGRRYQRNGFPVASTRGNFSPSAHRFRVSLMRERRGSIVCELLAQWAVAVRLCDLGASHPADRGLSLRRALGPFFPVKFARTFNTSSANVVAIGNREQCLLIMNPVLP